ncbi:MAG: helix-turn-helix domain-containing protein [Bacteroidaceae bacterium]|nr:helix-turn-helix domain-containing protein [Bacteroidaceae bacterium]
METLFILQFACCLVTSMLAIMLVYSRFQMRWINARYERSRWLICAAMVLLAVHYVLQMGHGLRASGDDVGAVINILFYTPCIMLISLGIINIECGRIFQKHYFSVGMCGLVVLGVTFLIGVYLSGSLHLGVILYVMFAQFIALLLYFIFISLHETHLRRKVIEAQTATDLLPFDRYTLSSTLFMCAMAFMLVFAIMNRGLLYVFGPLMLISLLLFVLAFIGLGYNYRPFDGIMEDDLSDADADLLQEGLACGDDEEALPLQKLDVSRMKEIDAAVSEWCTHGGFRNSEVTMSMLSRNIGIPRRELTLYFVQYLQSSFRVWLSDVRFQEARRMLLENPHYSNEIISVECGFSSHAQLYKIFRTKAGMTPRMFKEKLVSQTRVQSK